MSDPDLEIRLIAEQFSHAVDLLKAKDLLIDFQLTTLKNQKDKEIKDLTDQLSDMEKRLRDASSGSAQFKVFSGLLSGASFLIAIIAFVKAIFGG